MPRLSREFVKLETRLFNDHRFWQLSEFEQLTYLKMIGISRILNNKVTKELEAIKGYMRTERPLNDIKVTLEKLQTVFPKFKCNKHFYFFEGYEQRLLGGKLKPPNVSLNSGVDEDEDKEEDKDVDEDKETAGAPNGDLLNKSKEKLKEVSKQGINIYQLINKLKRERKLPGEIPPEVVIKVCDHYLKGGVDKSWPWFLKVFQKVSKDYFAEKNIEEGKKYKNEPTALGDILKRMAK